MPPAPAIQTLLTTIRQRWGDGAMVRARNLDTRAPGTALVPAEAARAHPLLALLRPYLRPGELVEISGGAHSGKSSLALALLAALLHAAGGEAGLAAYVDTPSTFYPPSAAATGIDLRRLWVVRLQDWPVHLAAVDLLLRSGALDVVLWDLVGQHRMPTGAQLQRLRMAAHVQGTTLLLLTRQPVRPGYRALDYGATLRLVVHRTERLWEQLGAERLLAGYRLEIAVARARGKPALRPIRLTLPGSNPEADGRRLHVCGTP